MQRRRDKSLHLHFIDRKTKARPRQQRLCALCPEPLCLKDQNTCLVGTANEGKGQLDSKLWGGRAEPNAGAQGGKAGTETQLSRKPPSPGKAGSPGCTLCPVHLLPILQPSRFSKSQSELVSPSKERIGGGAGPALEPRARWGRGQKMARPPQVRQDGRLLRNRRSPSSALA